MRFAVCVAGLLVVTVAPAQTRLSAENAYNPIPGPDGKKIVAVRTGGERPGGSGGLGRSNLRSDLIVLDREGHLLSEPIADRFVADWTREGIVAFRDWSYSLVGEDGIIRQQGWVCGESRLGFPTSGCVERVAYLATSGDFLSVHQKFGDSVLATQSGEISSHHHEKFLGEWLVPSPDERYVAVGPGHMCLSLSMYDLHEKTWLNLGPIVIHPDRGWAWMEPSWSPWFADSSQLAFFTSEGLVVSSPEGKRRQVVLHTREPAGLAVPSPDGRSIAYATFASQSGPSAGSSPIWNCTGIWVIDVSGSGKPRRLTEETEESTYDLRWLDNEHLVFDRIEPGIAPKTQLWTVGVKR